MFAKEKYIEDRETFATIFQNNFGTFVFVPKKKERKEKKRKNIQFGKG